MTSGGEGITGECRKRGESRNMYKGLMGMDNGVRMDCWGDGDRRAMGKMWDNCN